MKCDTAQQEILLVTTATLLSKELLEKNAAEGSHSSLSPVEQLEEACWQGLLTEWVPEIMLKPASGRGLFIWHIRQGPSLLQIELSEFPLVVKKPSSIDPAFFLSTLRCN